MIDESAYRHAQGEINRQPCVFERALLQRHAICEMAVHHTIDNRECRACAQPVAHLACVQLLTLLRSNSRFALKIPKHKTAATPLAQMKIQCGGLNGLKQLIDADAVAPDVHRLVRQAQKRYGELTRLPFSEIVKSIAAWRAS
ncbi:MAG TPA: hypothetical protein VJ001_14400 [Rhodocyclaceae bacterium]|nr:hypothetical protein [Rhodocyclaceae bacterium]